MKKLHSLIFTLFLASTIFAQSASNLVVFSEDGYKFYLILNGIRQNEKPQTNVKIMDLNQPFYAAKIIFEDKTLADIEKKNLPVVDPNTNAVQEVTYKIKKDKNGVNVLRYFSMVPVAQAPPVPTNVEVIHYNAVPMPPITTVVVTESSTTSTSGTGANISVGSNLGGVGISVSVNDPLYNGTVTHTSTTTTTTTSSSASSSSNSRSSYSDPAPTVVGCAGAYAMTSSNFSSAKNSISNQSFEESKLSTARQIISSNCLTTDQIKQIMLLFSFEDSRLSFAKEAHEKCVDPNNYFKVNDAFSFSSSVEDLNKSITK
jgi:hypothetical protein